MARKPLEALTRPASLHKSVQDAIKSYIIDNDLQAGDSLPSENRLGQQLGVSRNLIREAVRGLETLGIVDIRRGSGLYVGTFSFEPLLENLPYGLLVDLRELREMLEIRRMLEVNAIEAAIVTMSSDQIDELQAILQRMMVLAQKGVVYIDEDRAFHQCLFTSLENQTLLKVLDAFWLTFRTAVDHIEILQADPMDTYALHVPIVDAIVAGNSKAAQQALTAHYHGIEARLKRPLPDEE